MASSTRFTKANALRRGIQLIVENRLSIENTMFLSSLTQLRLERG